jgi:uncharacterized protein (DUF2267 family)
LDELVKQVAERAGISPDQARAAVTAVLGFLKERLPAPIAAQVDGLLGGSGGPDLGKGLGGLFGR